MGEMIGGVLGREHEVGRQAPVRRRRQPLRIGERPGRRDRLRYRADAADAGSVDERVARILAAEDALEAAVERRVDPGRAHRAVGDVDLHFEIALDPVERPDQANGHRLRLRSVGGTTT